MKNEILKDVITRINKIMVEDLKKDKESIIKLFIIKLKYPDRKMFYLPNYTKDMIDFLKNEIKYGVMDNYTIISINKQADPKLCEHRYVFSEKYYICKCCGMYSK